MFGDGDGVEVTETDLGAAGVSGGVSVRDNRYRMVATRDRKGLMNWSSK